MRAVKAARDCSDIVGDGGGRPSPANGQPNGTGQPSQDDPKVTYGLDEKLQGFISNSSGSGVDYILQTLLPLLTAVINEMCATKQDNPGVYLSLWLLERAGAPADLVEGLHTWLRNVVDSPIKPSHSVEPSPLVPTLPSEAPRGGMNPLSPKVKRQNRELEAANQNVDDETPPKARTTEASKTDAIVDPKQEAVTAHSSSRSSCQCGYRFLDEDDSLFCRKCGRRRAVGDGDGFFDSDGEASTKSAKSSRCPSEVDRSKSNASYTEGRKNSALKKDSLSNGKEEGKKRVSIWQEDDDIKSKVKADDESETKSSSSSDDAGGSDEEDAKAEMLRVTRETQRHKEMGGAPLTNRVRRFTVNISSTYIPPPPIEERIELLKGVSFFKDFGEQNLKEVSNLVRCKRYEPDETITQFGTACNEVHIILDGNGKVSVPHTIGTVRRGEVFGAAAPRLAGSVNETQVMAGTGSMTVMSIIWKDFEDLGLKVQKNIAQSCRVSCGDEVKRMEAPTGAASAAGSVCIFQQQYTTFGLCGITNRRIVQGYTQTTADREEITVALAHNRVLSGRGCAGFGRWCGLRPSQDGGHGNPWRGLLRNSASCGGHKKERRARKICREDFGQGPINERKSRARREKREDGDDVDG
jgi:hypothetical protein